MTIVSTASESGLRWDQLNAGAMQAAYERYRDWNVENIDWWEYIYEDATRMGALMGITIDKIQFSGFWSQGDGASYSGSYSAAPDAVAKIKAEAPQDAELHRIAEKLTELQIAYGPLYGRSIQVKITTDNSRYCHEMTMNFGIEDDEGDEPVGRRTKELVDTLRDFARWIYSSLEQEYDYLTSEECVMESLASGDYSFDEDGRII